MSWNSIFDLLLQRLLELVA